MFNQKFPGADRFTYSRHINLLFGGVCVKEQFGVSRNTNKIIGLVKNEFYEGVLVRQLKQVEQWRAASTKCATAQ